MWCVETPLIFSKYHVAPCTWTDPSVAAPRVPLAVRSIAEWDMLRLDKEQTDKLSVLCHTPMSSFMSYCQYLIVWFSVTLCVSYMVQLALVVNVNAVNKVWLTDLFDYLVGWNAPTVLCANTRKKVENESVACNAERPLVQKIQLYVLMLVLHG